MWLKNKAIAHRGFHDSTSPENSLAAFQKAIDKGYAIETDIQLLADGTVVVFHDGDLLRMCGVEKNLWQISLNEVKSHTLLHSSETIPTFSEFLHFVNARTPLLIELKLHGDTKIPDLCRAVAHELDNYSGEFAVQAFHPGIVKWFKDNRPNWLRGQLSCYFENEKLPFYQNFALKRMIFNCRNKPHFVAYDINHINSRFVRRARKKCTVLAWTVKAPAHLAAAKQHADNIIFEGFEA